MSPRPRIGVTGPDRGGDAAWLMTALAVLRAGGIPRRITPARPDDGSTLDGLIVGGGADVDPRLYRRVADELGELVDASKTEVNANHTPWSSKVWAPVLFLLRRLLSRHRAPGPNDPARDALERDLLVRAVQRDLPILGICRGAQLMNVTFGGTLWVDLKDFYVETPQIRTVLPRKVVDVRPGSRLSLALGTTRCHVNALHKQAVRTLGERLAAVACEPNGVVQAIEEPAHRFRVGVQWHPEYIPQHRRQRGLFEALVEAARIIPDAADVRGAPRGDAQAEVQRLAGISPSSSCLAAMARSRAS